MNNFAELMLQEQTDTLTLEEREFVEVHKQIVSYGEMTGRYFVEMCQKVKQMRDGKLYRAAGFETFGEYTETALNLKERQAYNYAKAADDFSEKYLQDHAALGITKLGYLAKLTAGEREEIEENINLSEASTREVDEAVKAALRERDEAQMQLDLFAAEKENLQAQIDLLATEKENLQAELADRENRKDGLQKAYDEKKAELAEAKKQAEDLKAKKSDLEQKLKEAKAAAKEVKTVPDEASKKLAEEQKARADELEQKLRETNAQLTAALEQKKTIATDDLLVFKVKFGDIQRIGGEMVKAIKGMDEETSVKCRKALNAVIDGWKEEMGL